MVAFPRGFGNAYQERASFFDSGLLLARRDARRVKCPSSHERNKALPLSYYVCTIFYCARQRYGFLFECHSILRIFLSYFQEVVSIYALCMLRAVQELIRKNISGANTKRLLILQQFFFVCAQKSDSATKSLSRDACIFALFWPFRRHGMDMRSWSLWQKKC